MKNGEHVVGANLKVVIIALISAISIGWFLNAAPASGTSDPQVVCRVEIDRKVLPVNGAQRAIVKVTLDAPPPPETRERPAVNLAIVLDRSGSMAGDKLTKAKEAAIEALRRLSPQDIFSLVVYDHNVRTIVPAQSAGNVEWIEGRIRNIRSGGNTALFGGVSQGAAEVRKYIGSQYVHRVILLSDGLANVGPSTPDDLGRLGTALIKENISVTTVGVGTDYNEDLMTRLAQNSDGNSYFVESSYDLPRIFASELGDVLSVVAKKVQLRIDCPEGVRPIGIIGRQGRIRGRSVELYMNQLYGSQEKYALVEVEISGGVSGEKKDIAFAQVSYENPFTRKNEATSGQVTASFSKDREEVRKSTNIGVYREYQLNLDAVAKDKAISLSDEGRKQEAVVELKQSASRLRQAGKDFGDESLLEKADAVEEQAAALEAEGMTKRQRKAMRTESFQMKNQQQQ
jgi:Ca-activated chloride channel family protein